jgi:hypothetical protein
MRLTCLLCVLIAFLLASWLPAIPALGSEKSEDFEKTEDSSDESPQGEAGSWSDTADDVSAQETSLVKKLKLSIGLDLGTFVPLKTKKRMYPADYASFSLVGMMPWDFTIRDDKVSLLLILDISYYQSRDPMGENRDHLKYHLFMPTVGAGINLLPSFKVLKFLPTLKVGLAFEHEHGQIRDWWSPTGYSSYNERRLGLMIKFGLCFIFQPLTRIGVLLSGEMISNFGGRNLMYAYEVNFGLLLSL